ncbi:ExbD/TolR family protein [Oceanobacter mangrovi]|uniref:ExbD/TolR family protein n=1 Tax=Oceanobacter mangrovi TaxID=2862510 RepID=UPI001C8D6362|nr:biopolymer transporter ExbD [Oceanobacter mangrovi]
MRRQRNQETAELNVTSFMNLMIVLVPVLLLNMVFSQISVLDLKLPTGDSPTVVDPKDVTLEVIIRKDSLEVSYSYMLQTSVVANLPNIGEEHDFKGLSAALQELKKDPVFADKSAINLLPEPGIDYQTLVNVMDSVRVYPAVVVTSVVDAQLFPDISLGAAPEEQANTTEASQ